MCTLFVLIHGYRFWKKHFSHNAHKDMNNKITCTNTATDKVVLDMMHTHSQTSISEYEDVYSKCVYNPYKIENIKFKGTCNSNRKNSMCYGSKTYICTVDYKTLITQHHSSSQRSSKSNTITDTSRAHIGHDSVTPPRSAVLQRLSLRIPRMPINFSNSALVG